METESLTGSQCRAARALLDWSAGQLAERSGASLSSIQRLEAGARVIRPVADALERALEAGGVEFLPGGGVQPKARP